MNKYVEIAYNARGLDPEFDRYIVCEDCGLRNAVDCEHIEGRGGKNNFENKMYDKYFLIFLCRQCHSSKSESKKEIRKEIVRSIIE